MNSPDLRMRLEEALDNLWSRITSRFSTVDGRMDDIDDAIDSVESSLDGVSSRVTGVEGRMTTAEGAISTVSGRVDDLEDAVDDLDGDMIKSISLNGTNVPKDAQGNVAMRESDPTVPAWAKQQMARTSDFTNDGPDGLHPYITAQDVTVPTKTSDLTNDGDDGNTYYVTWRQLSNSKDQAFISEDHIELTPDNIHDEFTKDTHYQGEANFLYITPAGMAAMLPEDSPYAKYVNCTFRGVYFTEKQHLTWDDYNILGWMEGTGIHELVTGYVDTTVGYGGEEDTIYITSIEPISGGGGGGGGDVNIIEAISFNGTNVPPDSGKRVSLTETDPNVPAWAKAQTKPTYTAQEVGALPNSTTAADIGALPDTTTFVSGVKGNAESSYRSGNVNITPANIGAVATSGSSEITNGALTVKDNNITVGNSSRTTESRIIANTVAGTLMLFAQNSSSGLRGLYGTNASGTGVTILTVDQNNNVTFNGNATNVSGVVGPDHGGTGATTPEGAQTNLEMFYLLDTATWSDIYSKLSKISGAHSAFVWLGASAVGSLLTGGRSDLAYTPGIVTNIGYNSTYRFALFKDGNTYSFSVSTLSASGGTPGTVYVNGCATKTVTATTDADGNISLGISASSYVVVSVNAPSLIVTPWVSSSDGNWHARITGVNGSAYASQSVTATVYYHMV